MEINSEGETKSENNNNDILINFESDIYKIILNIESPRLIIKLEPENNNPDKVFKNGFMLSEIRNWHLLFQSLNTLEIAKTQIENILKNSGNSTKIRRNENDVDLIINMFGQEIVIPLKKYIKQDELDKSNLSEEMKNIIRDEKIILGIDLGTTYSCASVMLDDEIVMIENSLGLRTTPSYVCFFKNDEICVGELAKLQPSYEYKNIIYNAKRLLGRNINDKEIKEIIPDLPFDVMQDDELNQLKIGINFKELENNKKEYYYPEQISALILKKLVTDSEYYLHKKFKTEIKIKNAVITVPAYFNQKQREATQQAADIINLHVERMINEPTAASLAYGYNSLENSKKLITVLDFGGGTLDLTLLQFIKNSKGIYCDIKFSFGDTHFGGEDFDYIIMKKCLEDIGQKQFDKKLQCNIRLKRACEIAKIKLSSCDSTKIILEEYSKDIPINFPLTKKNFEKYCKPLFDKFENILKTFINSSGYKDEKENEVILIGGSTLIPKIQSIIKKVFKYSKIKNDLNPKETVAKGAAIQAAMLSNLSSVKNINLLDVTNLSFGIRMIGNKMSKIIKRSTPIPEQAFQMYKTVVDNQTEALVEIFEGEDELTTNNLFLDKFTICNLPKKKKGEAKVKVNLFVNNDSILKVTAYDMQNTENIKELEIKRPKGLRDKIEQLNIKTKEIKENDLYEYIRIKDYIIDLEEDISKTNKIEELQEMNSKLINIFGEFLKEIIKLIDTKKIVISYIKYYFLKVLKYLENNKDDKIMENFDKNLNSILDEIQFVNNDLIFEIIEIFVDNKNLYSKCIIQLLDRYSEKIANQFFQVNVILKNEPLNYQKAFNDLEKLKEIIKLSQRFFDMPINENETQRLNLVKNNINEFKIKIEVKELIIRNRQNPIDFNKIKERQKLEDLYNKYQFCKSNDPKDLIDLESIIKKTNSLMSAEEKKADNFIKKFDKMEEDNFEKLLYIFDIYDLTNLTLTDIEEMINEEEKRDDFLVDLLSKYKKCSDNLTPGGKKDAIDKICVYLNHLKKKSEEKKPLFKNEKK